ncbi:hypothetical protein EIN_222030 [Entamoeba invadens IP1]|uniref:CID domain-containing protein n=1 Tax=Entamoeba invadens IP1 TaxID=370355 RepID=A0A0A1U5G0_ENTIV|nr:hypothetical protein EIN_222030 [Entamoeba invadens IP1]ELP88070.1 hypothetical protein EIN_222030 [Entamoeba invadens IP1]|eukprot:XP_004254841.1 hypothetical protein EIN_222030 [Entamoeba invadens IP1]
MSTLNNSDQKQFDMKLVNILLDISHGPEVVGCKPLEGLIDLVYRYPNCINILIIRIEQFIDSAPPCFLLSALYVIDSLIRYLADDTATTVEKAIAIKLPDIVRRICNTPSQTRIKVCTLLDHWNRHNTFGMDIVNICLDTLKNGEFVESDNFLHRVLRVSMKPERHFAFIATPTRSDAERLKTQLQKRIADIRSHSVPKVVWGTEYWMKNFKFEDDEGICTIDKDRIPPGIMLNADGTYIAERTEQRPPLRQSLRNPNELSIRDESFDRRGRRVGRSSSREVGERSNSR